jgi:hypothetical protein
MIVTVDQKRRIVLPKLVQPGDALDIAVLGQRMVLHVLKKPTSLPPVASHALKSSRLAATDLDEPAFLPLTDASPA